MKVEEFYFFHSAKRLEKVVKINRETNVYKNKHPHPKDPRAPYLINIPHPSSNDWSTIKKLIRKRVVSLYVIEISLDLHKL